MKKILTIIILILSAIVPLAAFASSADNNEESKKVKGNDYKIITTKIQKNKFKGLKQKSTGKVVVPALFHNIKSKKTKGHRYYILKNRNGYPILYFTDDYFDNLLEDYMQGNYAVKFYNYPTDNMKIYNYKKNKNYSNSPLLYKNRKLTKTSYPSDKNSIITAAFRINYPAKKDELPLLLDEQVKYEDEIIKVELNSISQAPKFSKEQYGQINKEKTQDKINLITIEDIKKSKSIDEIYNCLNKSNYFKFENYPSNCIVQYWENQKPHIKVFENGKTYEIPNDYKLEGVYTNKLLISSFLSQTLSIAAEISYQDSNNIIVRKKEPNSNTYKKMGIIDKYGNIKIPFEYERIISAGGVVFEDCKEYNNKTICRFIKQTPYNNIFFAIEKDGTSIYRVINDKNETIAYLDINDNSKLKEIEKLSNKIKYKKPNRFKQNFKYYINPVYWYVAFVFWLAFK